MALRKSGKARQRGGVVAALDVGSTKVCCLIARVDEDGAPRVVGVGQQSSQGVRGGAIVDMESVEAAIGAAVHAAERMAGETIRDVVVSLSGGQPTSHTIDVEVPAGGEIGDADLRRVAAQARQPIGAADAAVVHAIPVGYTVDGVRGVRDPRGMFGERLGVQLHVIAAAPSALRNLTTCVARNHLNVDAFVVSPYASGLACLVEDEKDLGCVVIDMGGGATTLAVFFDGRCVFTDVVPVGGAHVTNDIARGLTTPVAHAERMKTLHGCAMATTADERELIDAPQVGEEDVLHKSQIPKSLLIGVIQPRLEELFELVRDRLERSGFGRVAGRRVVLTGGGCQMPGTRELAGLIMDKQVRIGRPIAIAGLSDPSHMFLGGPEASTCAGLVAWALRRDDEGLIRVAEPADAPGGFLARVGTWLKENL